MLAAGGILAILLMGLAATSKMGGDTDVEPSPTEPEEGPETITEDPEQPLGEAPPTSLAQILFGTAEDDAMLGTPEDEVLYGLDGADTLVGGDGTDTLDGGAGDDRLVLEAGEQGTGGSGADTFEIRPDPAGNALVLVRDFEPGTDQLLLDFEGPEEEAPEITLDIETNPGSTLVRANGIAVTILENVSLTDPGVVEVVMLDPGSGSEPGSPGENLEGGEGDDTISGGDGADFLAGGTGNDSLSGDAGNDFLFGCDGDDTLEGGEGDDFLQGGFGADSLVGGDGDDRIDGSFSHGSGAFGPTDQDAAVTLDGGDGADVLILGAGDTATGGAGADRFASGDFIPVAEQAGTVTDFNPAEDVIEVLYDPASVNNPTITVVDFADGSGADIVLDGRVILHVTGAQGLDPAQVELREIALQAS